MLMGSQLMPAWTIGLRSLFIFSPKVIIFFIHLSDLISTEHYIDILPSSRYVLMVTNTIEVILML